MCFHILHNITNDLRGISTNPDTGLEFAICVFITKIIKSIYAIVFELNPFKITLVVKNQVGEHRNSSVTAYLQTSEKYSFDLCRDTSAKLCTHVKQILLN